MTFPNMFPDYALSLLSSVSLLKRGDHSVARVLIEKVIDSNLIIGQVRHIEYDPVGSSLYKQERYGF